MASSGSFETSGYSFNTGDRTLTFKWSIKSQDIENNTTTISWELVGSGSYPYNPKCGGFKVVIDGTTVYEVDTNTRREVRIDDVVASGTRTLTHNDDGTRSFSASAEAGIYTYARNVSGSGTWSLDIIAKAAKLVSVPSSFTDEDNPTITYNNAGGNAVTSLQACISLDGSTANISYRDITKTGTSYTFSLTTAERNTLRNATLSGSDSRSVYFILKTVVGSKTYYDTSAAKTLTIINANPTLSPTAVETNSTYIALTGSSGRIIRGHNSVSVAANATAKKGASISSYVISNGDKKITSASGTMTNVESSTFKFKVTDNRNLSTTAEVSLLVVDYADLTCMVKPTVEVVGEDMAKLTFEIYGTFFNGSFGSKTNSLTVKYRFKQMGNPYSDWNTLSGVNIANGRYSVTAQIGGLSYLDSYAIQAIAYDSLFTSGVMSEEKIVKAEPVFDWSGQDFNFNVPVSINGVELDYIVDAGTSGDWTYRKWNSGKAECWATISFSTAINTAWGSFYISSSSSRQSYPLTFTSRPVEQTTLQANTYQGILFPDKDGYGVNSSTQSARYAICRPSSVSSSTFYISYYVVGKWK